MENIMLIGIYIMMSVIGLAVSYHLSNIRNVLEKILEEIQNTKGQK